MSKYLAVLGRQPEISMAELEALLGGSERLSKNLAFFSTGPAGSYIPPLGSRGGPPKEPSPVDVTFGVGLPVEVSRLGGILKLAVKLDQEPVEYLRGLPEGKITIGVSDYSRRATKRTAQGEGLKLKKLLVREGRSVRMVENKDAVLSTATSLHNGLSGNNPRKVELIKVDKDWYRVVGVQDIEAYAKRDQKRPARDAKVGMLPPKLAQILINLCGPLKPGSRILDPFCGTGVVLQEALLMGYRAYGTDISERMVDYTERNLKWLLSSYMLSRYSLGGSCRTLSSPKNDTCIFGGPPPGPSPAHVAQKEAILEKGSLREYVVSCGDAMTFRWKQPIDAVACEGYLGRPFSKIPTEMGLKTQKQECQAIVLGFLKNLVGQIKSGVPVVIAAPAWLRPDGEYERMEILDEIENMGYNVDNKTREGLIYHREGQIVARDIIILRKK